MEFEQRDQPPAAVEGAMTPEQRDFWLGQWEALLAHRERAANEREADTDRRAHAVTEREQLVRELEERIDRRAREHDVPTASLQQRALEAITRSRALVAASSAGLERSEEALRRAKATNHRRKEGTDRRISAAERTTTKSESDVIQSSVRHSSD